MNPKEKDDEIIELTDEELDQIFADDDFDNGEEDGEIRSFYFSKSFTILTGLLMAMLDVSGTLKLES